MRVQAFFTSIFLLCCCFGNAQSWQSKIDRSVLQKITAGENVDCIVVLAEQADVSEAAFLPKKKDKGGFVFQKLVETAARTQVNVLKTLEDFQAPHLPFYVVNAVRVERGNLPLLEALARLPEVGRIDPNPLVHFQEPDKDVDPGGSRAIEWNVTHINADDVWAMGFNGTGTVVAGEDTGYDWDHPALQNKYRGWNGTSADHNYNWHDAIHAIDPHNSGSNPCGLNSPVPCDDNNHGTHTMGTMAGDDGAGNQIGVAPGAKWIGCRNMERGWGMPSTYLECFEWFLAPTNLAGNSPQPALAPDVINNSWGCPASEGCNSGNFYILETAINNLHSAGVMVVASAGNSGSSCSTVADPPAIYENSFSVGATSISDDIASFSSRGAVTADGSNRLKPNISAPGVNIRSSVNGGGYQSGWSGTSMAGPHVAAVVALMLDANPNLTMLQIENILGSTAVDRTSAQTCGGVPGSNIPNNTYGYGIVDALAAVNDALGLLPVELIDFQGHVQGAAVRLDWEVAPEGSLNHFEVEHADSRLDWTILGKQLFLPGMEFYHQLDDNPVPGLNYYRLKMVDIDGSIEYSKVIVVQLAENEGLVTYPNPVREELLLSATWETGAVEVRIFDAAGRLVQQTQAQTTEGQAVISVGVADLPEGVYFVKIMTQNGSGPLFQNKFVKF